MDEVKFGIIPGSACGSVSQAAISMSARNDQENTGCLSHLFHWFKGEKHSIVPEGSGWVFSALSGHPEFVRNSSAYMPQSISSHTESTHYKANK